MIKSLFALAFVFCLALAPVSAQKVGDKVYKTVIVNGQNISKWVLLHSVSEYDSNGNLIFNDNTERGYAIYYEYDKNNHLIHSRDNEGAEWMYKYDTKGNKIYEKDNFGFEIYYEYDNFGNKIYIKTNDLETWYEYDKNNHLIHLKDSKGYECWYNYDSNGNQIYEKNTSGYEAYYGYDNFGNIIYTRINDSETWYEHDMNGNLICTKVRDRKTGEVYEGERLYDYDDFEFGDSKDVNREYDDKGNLVHWGNSFRDWWYEYQYSSDGKIMKKYEYTEF